MANPKAFCSHRSVDKPVVMEVFRKLREAGIDAWVDQWEILPGQDFVAKINEGLKACDVGLVFLSSASMNGDWQQAEISALTALMVKEKKPLIPILLDADVPIDPLLLSRSKLGIEQFDQLVNAIYGRTDKPPICPPHQKATEYQFAIRLRRLKSGDIGVSINTESGEKVEEIPVKPGGAFEFSYMDFLKSRLPGSRLEDTNVVSRQVENDLLKLGKAVGKVVFPEPIANQLQDLMKKASGQGGVNLFFETVDPQLLSIPFEAARLPDGRAPALEPGVRVSRRISSSPASKYILPGPLKILVAVGAPDEGKTPNTVLDLEAELQNIIDGVAAARQYGNAYVKILEVAHPKEITKALKERAYHVLHLSGHGQRGQLELEDEDGYPVSVIAQDLAGAIIEAGRPLPHVFLSACHTGQGDSETVSLAHGLLERGVPSVLAMQSAVSDQYAIGLANRFYANLALSETPMVSAAISHARRELENERKIAVNQNTAPIRPPEYGTPSLLLRGEEAPLLDRRQEMEPVEETPRSRAAGTVPLLKIGDLVGRREEVRTIMRILTDDPRAVDKFGRKAGCVITGIGGVGKSTVAGRVMERLAEKGWYVVAVGGTVGPRELSLAIGRAALADGFEGISTQAKKLRDDTLSDEDRLYLLTQFIADYPVLLVLDNFEDNLSAGENTYKDPVIANLIQTLCQSSRAGRLLVTSRYPLPESSVWLVTRHLGPLSKAQTAKLFLRHSGLKDATPESLKLIQRLIGGHPRMIEYLDAIVNQGRARLAVVEEKLRSLAKRENIDLDQPGDKIEDQIHKALDVGAADIMLDELLELASKESGDRQVLLQAAVFTMPISQEGLQQILSIGGIGSKIENIEEAVYRLINLSLLSQLEGDSLWVHRWTAKALHDRIDRKDYQFYCKNGGLYLKEETAKTLSVKTAIESVRLLLKGHAWDKISTLAWSVVSFLQNYGQTIDLVAFCSEVTELLPRSNANWPGLTGTQADALLKLGYGPLAFKKYQESMKAQECLVDQEPGRADYLRDLLVSYGRIGDLHRRLGQGEAATRYYQKALEMRKRLVDEEPGRADYLRDLSVSYERMGDLHRDLGQGEAAAEYYQKTLEMRQRLVDEEPGRADYLRDLSVSYGQTGDLHRRLGQSEAATGYYQKALEIDQRLVDQEPDRADYLRDLSVSYGRTGDLHRGMGQGEAAAEYYLKAREIAECLVDQEPDRADYLRDLSVSFNKMGDLHRDLGQGEAAAEYYLKAREIAQRLVDQEPDRADYLRDLSVSFNKMGDLHRDLGQGEAAAEYYQNDLEIAQRLVDQEPDRADYLRDLSVSYNKMGDLHRRLGQSEAATGYYQKALEIDQRLVDQEPDRADYLRDLSVSYNKMGDLHRDLIQIKAAAGYYQKMLEISQRLVDQEPDRADYLRDLSVSFNKMGDLHRDLDQGEAATGYYQRALEIAQRLVDQEPDRADYLRNLSVSFSKMGNLFRGLDQGEAAAEYYQKTLEIRQRLVDQEPDRADYQVDLAVSLARTGILDSMIRGLEILKKLKNENRLSSQDEPKIKAIIELIIGSRND